MNSLYDDLLTRKAKLSVIGLGYVGLPIAVAFAEKIEVIGFDVNSKKINQYKSGVDPTQEVGDEGLQNANIIFSSNESCLEEARFHIVAVPTPITESKVPNLSYVESACRILGRNLQKNSIVVFESTVYPGVTEEVCIPILEEESGLNCDKDFYVGYSPERINPGDKNHRLDNIVKVVSARDDASLETISKVYELVVSAGVFKAKSIKVAEAAKVIENSQRDINIAFMNELSIIFNRMNIDTHAVIEAASSKWNFLPFTPGLVGGHCIGVDPYYLTYAAKKVDYFPQVVLAGRRINDNMSKYVAESTIKAMISADLHIKGAKVAVLGFTFKENCPDTRNTRVFNIVNELEDYGIDSIVCDPVADPDEVQSEYGIELESYNKIKDVDAIVVAVAHDQYCTLNIDDLNKLYKTNQARVLIDVKGIFNKDLFEESHYEYWSL